MTGSICSCQRAGKQVTVANASKIKNIGICNSRKECRTGSEEWGVTQEKAKKVWTKPELKQIGQIRQVAGAQTPNAQAAGNTKS